MRPINLVILALAIMQGLVYWTRGAGVCAVISLAQLMGGYLMCVTSFSDSVGFC